MEIIAQSLRVREVVSIGMFPPLLSRRQRYLLMRRHVVAGDSHVIEDKVHHRREDAETHDEVEDLRPAGDDEIDGVDGSLLSEHRQRESHEEDDHQHGAQEGGGLARQEEAHEEAVVAEPHTVGDPGAVVVVVAHADVAEAAVEGARRRVDVAEGAAAHGTEVSVVAAEVVRGVAGGCSSCY